MNHKKDNDYKTFKILLALAQLLESHGVQVDKAASTECINSIGV